MAKLLHIEASPRKERSHSLSVARALIDAYREANPNDEVETWDLWSTPLPEFDDAAINASYAAKRGQPLTADQQAAYDRLEQVFDRFAAADKYVFSLPMWNFGVPYKLKHFIDVVSQSGMAFKILPEGGYEGQLGGRPTAVVYASGGDYSSEPMTAMDHQRSYFDRWLNFVGITDVKVVNVAATAADPETVKAARAKAEQQAREVGASL
ncbi:FMN-dependent NADH-azoreductase 1 [Posidoniimonas polymericola]|uniref:FMN dependent NADH:quinone oxidoreductase n=1 Tax=Posidoniimonas polymericola TaxID=2528002 RepID=A0A5C5YMF4_9BACT|nr:NAD(P)H-dependent oxidoreductase [Posidoniimonas polymericola]TWT75938.1 FMN-dependent NADH-azoreductase 1 [Posidoniimonas polymericola]